MKTFLILSVIVALFLGLLGGWFVTSSQAKENVSPIASTFGSTLSATSEDLSVSMRKLWEDRIMWTRLYLVDFANGSSLANSDATRLNKNQQDLGNALKPYYGQDAGNQLAKLLKTHTTDAIALVKAAKAGDGAAVDKASTAWYANGNDIADFLASLNSNWSRTDLRSMMKNHLDLTKQEIGDVMGKKNDASVADYDNVHDEILQMADEFSGGIIKQFPETFK